MAGGVGPIATRLRKTQRSPAFASVQAVRLSGPPPERVKEQLDGAGINVPERTTSTRRTMGGVPFTRGRIYKILSDPIYLGQIHHKSLSVAEARHLPGTLFLST